jgi:MoaA/NifB/PqqE/SkfB family radical SAM enzyme
MCNLWNRQRDPQELNIEEWRYLIDALSKFMVSGPIRLHFGGGEPFLKEGIFDLIQFSTQKNFKTMVTSNGFLVDSKMASRISDSGLAHITFSLDSLEEKVHDYLRGRKGSQSRVLQAVKHINNLAKKPTLGINCLISAVNLEGILPLARWVISNDKISGVIFQAVIQPFDTALDDQWYTKDMFSELWPKEIEKVEDVIDQLIGLKKSGNDKISNSPDQLEAFKMYFRNPLEFIKQTVCPMNSASLLINWFGQVHFCGLLPNIGNIREDPIEEILLSKTSKDRQREMRLCNRNCNNKVNCFFKKEFIHYGG